jgi:uncharacterized membrane-anchored protein
MRLSRVLAAVFDGSNVTPLAVKVPQITALFWAIKITSTAMGEALADFYQFLGISYANTRRRERFYWATVLATFALGTAAGDWTATTLNFGFMFWFAYILTARWARRSPTGWTIRAAAAASSWAPVQSLPSSPS